jgi:flagellar protein FlaF
MNASAFAQTAYGLAAQGAKSERETEYQVFARVTGALTRARGTGAMADVARAIHDNTRLWTALAADLMGVGNRLPDSLRGQLLSLAQFSVTHGSRVLQGEADIDALIDINGIIMKGLRGDVADAA